MIRVDSLDSFLAENSLGLVEFLGSNCPACEAMRSFLESLEKDFSDTVTFGYIDVERHPDEMTRFAIYGVPAVLLFADAQVVRSFVGFSPKIKRELEITIAALKSVA